MSNQSRRFEEEYEKLKFSDDFMFGKTMEDPQLCRDVIECLLQRRVGELSVLQEQKQLHFTLDGKPIRLDVYSEDDSGVIFDTEMQKKGKKSLESLQLPKRSRFYQAAIDMDFLDKGHIFAELPESNILFICTFDPFGEGLAQYTFIESCREFPELCLGDMTEKHFYNCCYEGDDISDELSRFYEYIRTGQAESKLTRRIDDAVIKARKNKEWRSVYVKERIILWDAAEEGRAEERKNTERERRRAEKAEEGQRKAEARVRELEAQLASMSE